MPPSQSEDAPIELASPQWFATTHWSVVLAARDGDSPGASEALNDLCRAYCPPLYAYTGGTGRFAGATGGFTVERLVILTTGVTSGSFCGTIVIHTKEHKTK